MAYETKPNTGSLFANDKKTTDAHPNAKGTALIEGVEYWVSAWTNRTKETGKKYQSLKFERKEQQAAPAPRPLRHDDPSLAQGDDCPF